LRTPDRPINQSEAGPSELFGQRPVLKSAAAVDLHDVRLKEGECIHEKPEKARISPRELLPSRPVGGHGAGVEGGRSEGVRLEIVIEIMSEDLVSMALQPEVQVVGEHFSASALGKRYDL
jgi:hypothetical protein